LLQVFTTILFLLQQELSRRVERFSPGAVFTRHCAGAPQLTREFVKSVTIAHNPNKTIEKRGLIAPPYPLAFELLIAREIAEINADYSIIARGFHRHVVGGTSVRIYSNPRERPPFKTGLFGIGYEPFKGVLYDFASVPAWNCDVSALSFPLLAG
jgi:hypothetical protein